jgi:hypothetical protein
VERPDERLLQRFVLRHLEGRPGDVADDLHAAVLENRYYPVFQAALAALYADLGAVEPAQAAFEGLAVGDFAPVPLDEEWLLTMSLLADACAFLGDRQRAAILYERLEPYANRIAVGPIEVALGAHPGRRTPGSTMPVYWLRTAIGRPRECSSRRHRRSTANSEGTRGRCAAVT